MNLEQCNSKIKTFSLIPKHKVTGQVSLQVFTMIVFILYSFKTNLFCTYKEHSTYPHHLTSKSRRQMCKYLNTLLGRTKEVKCVYYLNKLHEGRHFGLLFTVTHLEHSLKLTNICLMEE